MDWLRGLLDHNTILSQLDDLRERCDRAGIYSEEKTIDQLRREIHVWELRRKERLTRALARAGYCPVNRGGDDSGYVKEAWIRILGHAAYLGWIAPIWEGTHVRRKK